MNPSAAFLCLCVVAVYSTAEKTSKTKRDVSGLFPFPRVGKGDVSWHARYFGPREPKRQELIPFPRAGRDGDILNPNKKRDMTENGGGMWFGPRLGRLEKRNYPGEDVWALLQIKDLPTEGDKKELFKPRLRGESSEEMDTSKDYHSYI